MQRTTLPSASKIRDTFVATGRARISEYKFHRLKNPESVIQLKRTFPQGDTSPIRVTSFAMAADKKAKVSVTLWIVMQRAAFWRQSSCRKSHLHRLLRAAAISRSSCWAHLVPVKHPSHIVTSMTSLAVKQSRYGVSLVAFLLSTLYCSLTGWQSPLSNAVTCRQSAPRLH